MTTIQSGNRLCTLINVFTVLPENQQELFDNLRSLTEEVFAAMPGYVSANLHLSDDGKTVTNYAQWASLEHYKAVVANEETVARMRKAAARATEVRPGVYSTIWSRAND